MTHHHPFRYFVAIIALLAAISLALVAIGQEDQYEGQVQTEDEPEFAEAEEVSGQFYEESVMSMAPPLEAEEVEAEEGGEQAETQAEDQMEEVAEAQGQLFTWQEGLFANVDAKELAPNNAYTLWLMTFNEPENCEQRPCSMEDLIERPEETGADVGYLDGGIAREDGSAEFSGYQATGELTQSWFDRGLQNPEQAEIHLVVRDHGPLVDDLAETMVNTFRGGCSTDSLMEKLPQPAREDGDSGPNPCRDIQVVIFMQPEDEEEPVTRRSE